MPIRRSWIGIRGEFAAASYPVEGDDVTEHTTAFGPAVWAAVIAGLATLVTLGRLIGNVVSRPNRWWWLVPLGVLLISYIAVIVVTTMSRPLF